MKCIVIVTMLLYVIIGLLYSVSKGKYEENSFIIASMIIAITSFCFGIRYLIHNQNIESFVWLLMMFIFYMVVVYAAKDGFDIIMFYVRFVGRFLFLVIFIHLVLGNLTSFLEKSISIQNILVSRSICVIIICCILNIILLFTSKISYINNTFANSTIKVLVTFYINYMIYIYMIQIKDFDLNVTISCLIVCFSIVFSFFDKIEDVVNYFIEPLFNKGR